MNARFTWLAVAAVRMWTRAYTWGVPGPLRERRRAEVESDLWESVHDEGGRGTSLPLSIAGRLLRGVPDDLGWRFEQEDTMPRPLHLGLALTAVLTGVFALWLLAASSRPDLPTAPAGPRAQPAAARVPPPPPPPATPGRLAGEVPRVYGETSYTVRSMGRPPHKVRDVPPVYPPMAIWGGLEGRVSIEATVDTRGRVADARVIRPSIRMLDQSALDAVKQWEFEAATHNGVPVEVLIVATVDFVRPH